MSNTPIAYDIATIRAELQLRAQARETITYGQTAILMGLSSHGLAPVLIAIRNEEARRGRPDLGCLVVRADTGFPADVSVGREAHERALAIRLAVFSAWRLVR